MEGILSQLSGRHVFLGISLSSVSYLGKRVATAYAEAMKNRTASFVIVLADELESFNYETDRQLQPHEARQRALRVGRSFLVGYKKLSATFPFVRALCVSEFFQRPEIQEPLSVLQAEYEENALFRQRVDHQIKTNRKAGSLVSDGLADPRYLLSEYAIMTGLYHGLFQDRPIQISPKPDELFYAITSGAFAALAKRLNVSPESCPYVVFPPELLPLKP